MTILLALTLVELTKSGFALKMECEDRTVNPGKSQFVTLSVRSDPGVKVTLPDLRERVVGFSLAEDFAEEPVTEKDGATVQTVNWRLVPEPCASVYKIRPTVVAAERTGAGSPETYALPVVYFDPPAARDPVSGEMEIDPKKDLPPLSWRLVGWIALLLAALAAAGLGLWWGARYLARRVREHRMSPIERAWAELDRLIRKGLPGRGRYKDFYVELTMVVRRYVQRKYGVKAPHLTTEEFLREIGDGSSRVAGLSVHTDSLRRFLESADMVKFAGIEATPEMADQATASAKGYLESDNAVAGSSEGGAS